MISNRLRLLNFKNRSLLSGQEVVQSEPNQYPRLPVLFRLQCKKNGPPNVPRKKFVFQSEILTYSLAYSVFKNIEVSSGQGVVQIKPNSVSSIPWVIRL